MQLEKTNDGVEVSSYTHQTSKTNNKVQFPAAAARRVADSPKHFILKFTMPSRQRSSIISGYFLCGGLAYDFAFTRPTGFGLRICIILPFS